MRFQHILDSLVFTKWKEIKIFIISTCNMHVVHELSCAIWLNIILVNAFYELCFLEVSFAS